MEKEPTLVPLTELLAQMVDCDPELGNNLRRIGYELGALVKEGGVKGFYIRAASWSDFYTPSVEFDIREDGVYLSKKSREDLNLTDMEVPIKLTGLSIGKDEEKIDFWLDPIGTKWNLRIMLNTEYTRNTHSFYK